MSSAHTNRVMGVTAHTISDFDVRDISAVSASLAVAPSRHTATTCSVIGISTLCRMASSRTEGELFTPSAIIDIEDKISSSDSPWPNRTPTVVLRLFIDEHVAIKSPTPASPDNVGALPPIAMASRVISANPLVMRVALEFSPNPIPEAMPAAIAMTFFTTPAISHPTTSEFVYTRNVAEEKIPCN
jgi:hypothetical protein